jgi:hypothetical protein
LYCFAVIAGQGRPVVAAGGFRITSYGKVSGFSFTTSAKVNSITFTLNISGQPATAGQIYQGSGPAQASQPSPLTCTRK